MVLKKDPRAVLDMLSKPVDMDEDEFLDKLDKDVRTRGIIVIMMGARCALSSMFQASLISQP